MHDKNSMSTVLCTCRLRNLSLASRNSLRPFSGHSESFHVAWARDFSPTLLLNQNQIKKEMALTSAYHTKLLAVEKLMSVGAQITNRES